jgi:hypothetical protein
MKKSGAIIILTLLLMQIFSSCQMFQRKYTGLIDSLMYSRQADFAAILKNPKKFEVQIIYTQINRDSLNRPTLKSYYYEVDKNRYFYPASMVKLPAALLALEKINGLKAKGIDKFTTMRTDSARAPQTTVRKDTTAQGGNPSVAHYIKKMFLVSDNDAFNRLYEFIGQAYFNEHLWEKGYKDALIIQRIHGKFDLETNRYTNPVRFVEGKKTLHRQAELHNKKQYSYPIQNPRKGKAHIDKQGKKVNQPFDFSDHNYISLQDLHDMLKAVVFPEVLPASKRFNLKPDDYQWLRTCMSAYPRESTEPAYPKKPDSFRKYLWLGNGKQPAPSAIRIFNKVGQSYGFMIDCAYIVDFEKKIEFMLSAVIYVNQDEVLNDDAYEYDSVGFPFMERLGKLFYDYESKRPKKFLPDLSAFRLSYNKL